VSTRTRSAKRTEFLKDVLVTAVESNPYTPWFQFRDYDPDAGTVTVWHDQDEEGTYKDGPHYVTLDSIASVLAKYCESVAQLPEGGRNTYKYQLVRADRSNGDEGDYDVTTADAVMQIAVLGEEIYA
jgi:hypothetical protein